MLSWLAMAPLAVAQNPVFVRAIPMPAIVIDQETVKIHTQGLFVTEQDFFVTGRVDTAPRQPILIQIPRQTPTDYRVLALGEGTELDHPGGFDRDVDGVFWIPVSTSHRRGPTEIVGIRLVAGRLPSNRTEIQHRISVPDHIGAICCLPNGKLLGANWDTQKVYQIRSRDGSIDYELRHEEFFGDSEIKLLAVQDWKYDSQARHVIAGGIDKSSRPVAADSRAVIVRVDPIQRKVISILRLGRRDDVSTHLSNEGMAWHENQLFLLPEDFRKPSEHRAKVLQFDVR